MGACFSITDISKEKTVQLTGQTVPPAERKKAWDSKNVFFCTPQVLPVLMY
jgi:ERCC4-related helicase